MGCYDLNITCDDLTLIIVASIQTIGLSLFIIFPPK
jgi:hypothetical protein